MGKLNWIKISYEDLLLIPEVKGVYRIRDGNNFWYIGKSGNIKRRVLSHRHFIASLLATKGEIFIEYAETNKHTQVEKELIKINNPILNGTSKHKIISNEIQQIKKAMDGRKLTWLCFEARIPMADLSKKMGGKLPFTTEELQRIEKRLNFKIETRN